MSQQITFFVAIDEKGLRVRGEMDHLLKMRRVHVPMPLDRLAEYPILAGCLDGWRRLSDHGLPETIDPVEMPVEAIKAISLIDWDDADGSWFVRLSSTLMDQGHGRTMTGKPLSDGFSPEDYPGVCSRLDKILASGEPDLARHEFTDARGRRWAYTRLVLPLSSDGMKRDRYAVVYDPGTFGQRLGG